MSFERMSVPSAERPLLPEVPESEIEIDYARSSGPGGQNVNKLNTKAVISWNVRASSVFTEEQMALIERKLANKINKQGEVIIMEDRTRSQAQNHAAAVKKLQESIRKALTPKAERVPTKVSKAKKRRRVADNRIHSAKKRERGRKDWD